MKGNEEDRVLQEEAGSLFDLPHVGRLALMRFQQDLREDPVLLEEVSNKVSETDPQLDFKDNILKVWTSENLKEMTTTEIIDKLRSMNVKFDEESFKQQAQNHISAIQLAEDHYYTQDFTAEKHDEDFIWLAIMELWNRLIPNHYNIEMIDESIQQGYKSIGNRNYSEGVEEWGTAWEIIKSIVPSDIKSVEDADEFMPVPLTQSIFNWCQDFETKLNNAGIRDQSFFKKRIRYCREFCQIFPESYNSIIHNMLRAEAQSYAALGDTETAENLFEKLIKMFPENIWGYIGWGDMYWFGKHKNGLPNYDKAEEVYRMGLAKCSDEKEVIYDRLEQIKELRNKQIRKE